MSFFKTIESQICYLAINPQHDHFTTRGTACPRWISSRKMTVPKIRGETVNSPVPNQTKAMRAAQPSHATRPPHHATRSTDLNLSGKTTMPRFGRGVTNSPAHKPCETRPVRAASLVCLPGAVDPSLATLLRRKLTRPPRAPRAPRAS